MTSKTSLPTRKNEFRQTFRWALRKNAGMTGLLAALLFVCLPMILLLALSNSNGYPTPGVSETVWRNGIASEYASFLRTMIPLAAVSLLLLFSVVLCVRLFGYMQNRRSEDLFHALPVGRVPMLLGRWCAGMVALALPALGNFGVLALIALAYRIPLFAGGMYLGTALCWLLLMAAAAFTFLTFLSVCSGSVMDTILSALGVNVGFPAAVFLSQSLIRYTLPGAYDADRFNFAVLSLLAPFPAAYLPHVGEEPVWFLPWWICATAALLAGACLLYRRRRSESAEDRFAFAAPKIVIRFLLTACGGLGLGLAGMFMTGNIAMFLLLAAAGSLMAHTVVEAVYSRGFRGMKRSLRWYAIFAVCFAAFYGVLATGCFGFDTRVPDPSEVESISIDATGFSSSGGSQVYRADHDTGLISGPPIPLEPVLKKPESIRAVLQFHRELVAKYRAEKYPYVPQQGYWGVFTLRYRLKNGSTLTRSFLDSSGFSEWMQEKEKPLLEMEEYRENNDMVFFLQPDDLLSVTVYSNNGNKGSEYLLGDGALRGELLDALRSEYDADRSSDGGLSLKVREPFRPDDRLREALGGYSGEVAVGEPSYSYRADGEVARVLKEIAEKEKVYGFVENTGPAG